MEKGRGQEKGGCEGHSPPGGDLDHLDDRQEGGALGQAGALCAGHSPPERG